MDTIQEIYDLRCTMDKLVELNLTEYNKGYPYENEILIQDRSERINKIHSRIKSLIIELANDIAERDAAPVAIRDIKADYAQAKALVKSFENRIERLKNTGITVSTEELDKLQKARESCQKYSKMLDHYDESQALMLEQLTNTYEIKNKRARWFEQTTD